MTMDEPSRSLPPWLAPAVQQMELNNKLIVTLDEVHTYLPKLDRPRVRTAVSQLIARGWLHPTGVRGVYEFIPGAAAGPYPSGDPWLRLRAELLIHPLTFHVGATSAAWLLGYAQRSPERHVVVVPSGTRVAELMRATYRVLETSPAPSTTMIESLPVPTPTELLAETAQLAPRLNLDAAQGWLRRLLADITPEEVAEALRDRSPATRARAGYIVEACSAADHAQAIADLGLPATGPFYTGGHHSDGRYSARWNVYDSGRIAS